MGRDACLGLAYISTYILLLFRFLTPHPDCGLYQSLALPIFFSLAAVSRFPTFETSLILNYNSLKDAFHRRLCCQCGGAFGGSSRWSPRST